MDIIRNGIRTLLVACTLGATMHAASTEQPEPSATMAIEGGLWFDGTRFTENTWYVVDGKFTRSPPARIDVQINATGRYIVPPFADAHNHNLQNAWGMANNLYPTLQSGVFYLSQMCAQADQVRDFRPLVNRPTTPDVLFATACISASDGHPLGLLIADSKQMGEQQPDLPSLRKMYVALDSDAEVATRWDDLMKGKPDFIKVILIDSANHAKRVGQPALLGRNGLDPKLLPGIVQRAHAAGVRVVVHPDTAADAKAAVEAGADLLAHLPGYRVERGLKPEDYRLDDETIALLAKRKIPVIATASVSGTMYLPDSKQLRDIQTLQKDNLARLINAGVPLLIGSDNPFKGPLYEVDYLDALKVLPRERILALLTMDTPRAMFPARQIGRFEEGAEASFLLLEANPLNDLSALRRLVLRVKQGNVLALR